MIDWELREGNMIYACRFEAMELLGGFFADVPDEAEFVNSIHCGAEQLLAEHRKWA